jgi:putative DNA methylase
LKKDTIVFGPKKGQAHPKGPVSGEGRTAWEVQMMTAPPEVVKAVLAEHAPPVLDPFCGGGSIPLEAQRLGLTAHASDLNPVAVLITKALIEIPPKFAGRPPVNPEWHRKKPEEKAATAWHGAAGLAEDVRYYGKWMRDEAEKQIGHLYPKVKISAEMARERPDLRAYVGQEMMVIAWLWARTVVSPNPACGGAHVPLVRSFWLSTRKGKEAWIETRIDREGGGFQLAVRVGKGEPSAATMGKKSARCLLSGAPITREHIRREGLALRLGLQILAVVIEAPRGRLYLTPTRDQEQAAWRREPPSEVADVGIVGDSRYLTPTSYGMMKYRDHFTARQLVTMSELCHCVGALRAKVLADSRGDVGYTNAVVTYIAFALDKTTEYNCSLVPWDAMDNRPKGVFARQALPIVWDFAEVNLLSDIGGSFKKSVDIVAGVLDNLFAEVRPGTVSQDNAMDLQAKEPALISTDPPYYDNVPYADLSDFFYVWLRQTLHGAYPDLLATLLVPKAQELVADPFRHGGRDKARTFFEHGVRRALGAARGVTFHHPPATIYYAFKQAEDDESEADERAPASRTPTSTGWETFLQGLVDTGWEIDGTWPLRTERTGRIRDNASNALASSIVLVCRPRPADAPLATRKQFITALRAELPDALRNLQRGNIAPVDLAQAAIGPGMAVFTRYARVMESDGSPMRVRTALQLIYQALDDVLAEQEASSMPTRAGPWPGSSSTAWTRPPSAWPRRSARRRTRRSTPWPRPASSWPAAARCGWCGATSCPTAGTRPPTAG